MNKNFIKELNVETTYLEFRILTYLECEEKMKKNNTNNKFSKTK